MDPDTHRAVTPTLTERGDRFPLDDSLAHHAQAREGLDDLSVGLPVKLVVFNNSSLGFVELGMKAAGILAFATGLHTPDFSNLAVAAGLRAKDPCPQSISEFSSSAGGRAMVQCVAPLSTPHLRVQAASPLRRHDWYRGHRSAVIRFLTEPEAADKHQDVVEVYQDSGGVKVPSAELIGLRLYTAS